MTRLNELRRWENVSNVDQGFYNDKQGAYQVVPRGGFIEGAQFAKMFVGMPWFRETTRHLVAKELYPIVQEETDIEALMHMAKIEKATARRDGIIALFDNRIKAITKEKEVLAKA